MAYISLRSIREQKGLTIAQLAGKASISIRTLQAYEAGERTIAPDDLRKLARILATTSTEILRPGEPPPEPPAPPPAPIEESSASSPPLAPVEGASPSNRPEPPPASPATPLDIPSLTTPRSPRNPLGGGFRHPSGGPPPRTAPAPRAPRPPRPAPVPGPASPGQLDQIHSLARRLGLEESTLIEQIGGPLDALNQSTARAAITKLRQTMEETGTWRPRVGEGPDQEGEYLSKLRQQATPIEVLLFGGKRLRGLIEDFTPYAMRLRGDDGSEIMVRKLAVIYYRTLEVVDDAQ